MEGFSPVGFLIDSDVYILRFVSCNSVFF